MTFQDTLSEAPSNPTVVALWIMAGIALVSFCVAHWKGQSNGTPKILVIIVLSVLSMFVFPGMAISNQMDTDRKHAESQRDALKQNIMQKYQVDDVNFAGKGYEERGGLSASYTDEQTVVVDIDDSQYAYTLTQDKDTFEPTLRNLEDTEENTTEHIDSRKLLKNKTN